MFVGFVYIISEKTAKCLKTFVLIVFQMNPVLLNLSKNFTTRLLQSEHGLVAFFSVETKMIDGMRSTNIGSLEIGCMGTSCPGYWMLKRGYR